MVSGGRKSSPAENAAGGEVFLRWLAGDGEALVAALKRERRRGRMKE
jgi:hypothetical protein